MGDQASKLLNANIHMQTFVLGALWMGKTWIAVLFYINMILCLVLAVFITWANIGLISNGIDGMTLFFLTFVAELADIFLNFVEDLIVLCGSRKNPLSKILMEIPLPGFGIFSFSCCRDIPDKE